MSNHPEIIAFCAEDNEVGMRLDKAVVQRLDGDFSRTEIQQWIKDGHIRVNNTPCKASHKLEATDCVEVEIIEAAPFDVEAEDLPINIIYDDEHIVVVDKAAGMVVHPGHGNETGTLVNGLLATYPEIRTVGDDETRAGIVHRLDKDVSGVMVVAKTDLAFRELVSQFQARDVKKHYIALVEHPPTSDKGIIEAPIGRDPRHRKRMAVVRDGKPAVTEFYVREYIDERVLLDVFPQTGRTHQIRVHLAFINCPIVGDDVYGYRKQRIKMKRIFLHAHQLTINHPLHNESRTFSSEMPTGLLDVLRKLDRA